MSILTALVALHGGLGTVAFLLFFLGAITSDMPGLCTVVAGIVV